MWACCWQLLRSSGWMETAPSHSPANLTKSTFSSSLVILDRRGQLCSRLVQSKQQVLSLFEVIGSKMGTWPTWGQWEWIPALGQDQLEEILSCFGEHGLKLPESCRLPAPWTTPTKCQGTPRILTGTSMSHKDGRESETQRGCSLGHLIWTTPESYPKPETLLER